MVEDKEINEDKKSVLLSRAAIFSDLTSDEIKVLAVHSAYYTFNADEFLYRKGSSETELFVLDTGEVNIIRESDSGRSQVVARFVSGESFGELDLLSMSPREESAQTTTTTNILIFPARGISFQKILSSNPAWANRVLKKFMCSVADRIRQSNKRIKENSPWIQELRRKFYTDFRTGLPNRTFLEDNLSGFFSSGRCSLLMFKPDNFKEINDSFGHKAGDIAIEEIGEFFSGIIAEDETAVRFMSNEFAVILPDSDLEKAKIRAGEIQDMQCRMNFRKATGGTSMDITVSVGIAQYPDHADTPAEIIRLAHEYAMMGRQNGRRRILVAGEEVSP